MLSRSLVPVPKNALSLHQTLELTNLYLENAYKTTDHDISLVLCHDAEVALSQAKDAKKLSSYPGETSYQALRDGVAAAYIDLGKLLERKGYPDVGQTISRKAEKWGGNAQDPGRLAQHSRHGSFVDLPASSPLFSGSTLSVDTVSSSSSSSKRKQRGDSVRVDSHIFSMNVRPPIVEFKLPEPDERLNSTPQLVCCLGILQASRLPDVTLELAAHRWLKGVEKDTDEQERLHMMATEVVRAFKRDEIKETKIVNEVVILAPVLNKDIHRELLLEFYSGIEHSGLLNVHQLDGIAQLIQGADPGYLDADDLVKILGLLSTRLRNAHKQSTHHMHQLTLAVSHVLDAMADTKVTDLDRETLHEPLSTYLQELKGSPDPYLVYQAAYAYQALLCVPDNETVWQAAMRRTGKVIQGVSGLVSAVKGLDLIKFIDGLDNIQQGLAGMSKVFGAVKNTYERVTTLAESGHDFMDCLNEGFSFKNRRDWYSALRGADTLIRDGELAAFRKLVCEVSCRLDPAFQWGVCQRLGDIAANPLWDAGTRRSAIAFLGEIYRNDKAWGQQPSVKQWILNILMQLASSSGTGLQVHSTIAQALLEELEASRDQKKQAMYRKCRQEGPIPYPMKVAVPELASPSLLDRVQNRPDVEGNLRILRKQRTKERGIPVYIPPQAKASIQVSDDARFPLMEKVKEFLKSDQKVFLLQGESGAGKSTFNRELEYELWQSYESKTGRIPLHINLPTIDKPEHDLIAKQLRKTEFTEPQIREMKQYRKFVLICDGYDESQQTHNLYMSNRLNQPGEWDAQMVISCRSEYLGSDYRDRFQPGDRNRQSDSSLLQEAVITPFTLDQVHAYIQQYVLVHQPLWQTEDYKQALKLIPSLQDLMKNPFLMTLSLEVLPRMVDPGQHLSSTRVTRVALYDHFVEQWLERGKKRLGEKDLTPQARAALESLNDEGFTQHGIEFLKNLAVAIYKEQGGHPIVKYSRVKGEHSWKDAFFSREDEKQLLREACPLTRNGNQHRFIHRSLLEYGLARAIFDPQDDKIKASAAEHIVGRRGSVSSTLSFESHGDLEEVAAVLDLPDPDSPLAWKNLVNDHSLLQFLEERVQQEPVFKKVLLSYIEHSKEDPKWRKAAANAITILVRSGVQFIGTNLQGIRIPGADLSYGVFDSTQLQGADLRKVNLRGVWLRQSDLSRSQMKGVRFGEFPLLHESNKVRSCAYSHDGKLFAVGRFSGDITMYTTSNWERALTLKGHTSWVQSIAFSPKGDQVASCSLDKTARLWNVESGTCTLVLSNQEHDVYCIAYSPQGDHLAFASAYGTVRIWDSVTGDRLQTLSGHGGAVLCVAYSPKGNQIASGSFDKTVRLWDNETRVCTRILSGHSDIIWGVAYSLQGDQLASSSMDKTIRLWDLETGTCRYALTGHSNTVFGVAFSPRGDQVSSSSQDGTVRLWDVETGLCRHTMTGHGDTIFSVVYSPNGDQVASASADQTVRLWDVSAAASRYVSNGHSMSIMSVKFSPNGDRIASSSWDRTIRLWDAKTGSCHRAITDINSTVQSVAYSPSGRQIVAGSTDRMVRLWDAEAGTCERVMAGHSNHVYSVAYSPHGHQVASASDDMTVRLWNVVDGECCAVLNGHDNKILSVMYSPDGQQIATASKDNSIRLWDAVHGTCLQILKGHDNWVWEAVYSPRGNQLASASSDKTVRLWDLPSGECSMTLMGHHQLVLCVAYSALGDLLASGSWDRTVRLYNTDSGQCRAVIRNFQDAIRAIDWTTTREGSCLVTGCEDGSILKWEVIEEEEEKCRVQLQWSATRGALSTTGASIQDVRGLTTLNKKLLKQRGAAGEPESMLQESSRKLMMMASVVSKLGQTSGEETTTLDSASTIDVPSGPLQYQG